MKSCEQWSSPIAMVATRQLKLQMLTTTSSGVAGEAPAIESMVQMQSVHPVTVKTILAATEVPIEKTNLVATEVLIVVKR